MIPYADRFVKEVVADPGRIFVKFVQSRKGRQEPHILRTSQCCRMVLLYSFSRKFGSLSQIFVKKNGVFRPAGSDIPLQTATEDDVRTEESVCHAHKYNRSKYSGSHPQVCPSNMRTQHPCLYQPDRNNRCRYQYQRIAGALIKTRYQTKANKPATDTPYQPPLRLPVNLSSGYGG